MKNIKNLFVVILSVFVLNVNSQTINVDTTSYKQMSKHLYGIFFEEINHSGDGGLYAEMVQNRDFELYRLPDKATFAGNLLLTQNKWYERKWYGNDLFPWRMVGDEKTLARMVLDRTNGINRINSSCLNLEIEKLGNSVSVVNDGYWGMFVEKGKSYRVSFFLKSDLREPNSIGVSIRSANGKDVYANSIIELKNDSWQKYELVLTSSYTDNRACLSIDFNSVGSYFLDVVSLMPVDTYNKRENGLRSDLVEMLKGLNPSFLRFPGGAIVGGLNLDNRIKWKNSIGPIEKRIGTMNLWGYYTSNGLGFHEYLQLCEDLNADALWVCNPGFSDNYRHAEYATEEEFEEILQNTLDAIEYAVGDVNTRWGAERARNGHSKPFPLKYLEIGNEAHGEVYEKNYDIFYREIKKYYPEIQIISNVSKTRYNTPIDIVDIHKYGDPDSFYDSSAYLDKHIENNNNIYIGEYGCDSKVGEGNYEAALSEAAFLINVEERSDKITMCSYAPLFFNVNDIAWPVNLIGFDNQRCFARSSYYVQQMFSANRPDIVYKINFSDEHIYVTVGKRYSDNSYIIKILNKSNIGKNINISGLDYDKSSIAEIITLSHDNLKDENSLYYPELIVPVHTKKSANLVFDDYKLKPYSLQLIKVQCE